MPARHILVLVTGDPMKSARPGEAIRMALGLGSGTHTVSVVLRGPAVALLFPEAEESACADEVEKYLPSLAEALDPGFYVERSALQGRDPGDSEFRIVPVEPPDIAKLVARADRFVIF
ncbi:MAG: DsrE family protein [Nitrospirae bacterium]|nr:DsrE family protein [Nitrospirota bacterium]